MPKIVTAFVKAEVLETGTEERPERLAAATACGANEGLALREAELDGIEVRLMIERYAEDLYRMTSEIARVLRPGGTATLVVGNSYLKGTFIENSAGVIEAAIMVGLTPPDVCERALPDNRRYLFGILAVLLVSALGMAGAGQALGFIFRPSFGELDGGSVLEALGHAFFTLSLGMGTMVTYGSYIAKHQSIVKASAIIVVLDTLIDRVLGFVG